MTQSRQDPHRRFRLPGDPAHRPARARAGRLLGGGPVRKTEQAFPRIEAQGGDPVGRSGIRDDRHLAAGASRAVRGRHPVFGICYGQQAMAAQLGGEVEGGHHAGRAGRDRNPRDSPLFRGIWHVGQKYPVWMSHGDRVHQASSRVPAARLVIQRSARHGGRRGRQFGVQFRPKSRIRLKVSSSSASCARSPAARAIGP